MNISKKVYEELNLKQRAVSCFSALIRDDKAEIDRLINNAPKEAKHGQAIFAMGQALDTYNYLISQATSDSQRTLGFLMASTSYCEGWLDAGGAVDGEKYLNHYTNAMQLAPLAESLVANVRAVKKAAREWCEKNNIPEEFFSSLLSLCSLGDNKGDVDEDILQAARSTFAAIRF